jgi:hypothetical protein
VHATARVARVGEVGNAVALVVGDVGELVAGALEHPRAGVHRGERLGLEQRVGIAVEAFVDGVG